MRCTRLPPLLGVLHAAVCLPVAAQTPTVPPWHLAPRAAGDGLEIPVRLGDAEVVLALHPVSLRAERFRVLVDDGSALREVPAPPAATFRGVLRGREGTVAASVAGGQVWAVVHTADGTWAIQPHDAPAPGGAHVVYRGDAVQRTPLRCACEHGARARGPAGPRPSAPVTTSVFEAEIAVDADHDFFVRHGSTVAATVQAIERVLNPVDEVYRRDVQIRYRLTTLIVRTQPVYTSPLIPALLAEFEARWNQHHATEPRDVAHLFTGRADPFYYGIANLDSVCAVASAYAVSAAFQPLHLDNVVLVAHELGHNWSAPHCLSFPCYIMCPLLGCAGAVRFGSQEQQAIVAYRDAQTCLRVIPAGAITTYGSGCAGSAGVPRMGSAGRPVLGLSFSWVLGNARPGTGALLLFGRSDAAWNGVRLPWSLAGVGAPGCSVLASGDALFPVPTDPRGAAVLPLAVPPVPELFGLTFFGQWLVADPGANALGIVLSDAGAATLGSQ